VGRSGHHHRDVGADADAGGAQPRRDGEQGRLRDLRLLFQYAEVATFCDPIERLTGRKVRAFVSGIDAKADLASELFVLHPPGFDGTSRADPQRVDRDRDGR
jgi:hypothetical protein